MSWKVSAPKAWTRTGRAILITGWKKLRRIGARLPGSLVTHRLRDRNQLSPVPIETLIRHRERLPGENPLVPLSKGPSRIIRKPLRNDYLRKARIQGEFSPATLGPESINYLETLIRGNRPRRILELGSGVSTLCLARFMFESLGPNSSHTVTSLEQDEEYAGKTRGLLREHGLDQVADVVVAPLTRHFKEGEEFISYRLSHLRTEVLKADFLLIDGPLGPPRIRTATLPLLLTHLAPGAEFVLDDAMRDGELEIATAWAENPEIAVVGVVLIEKGLLYGRVTRLSDDHVPPLEFGRSSKAKPHTGR